MKTTAWGNFLSEVRQKNKTLERRYKAFLKQEEKRYETILKGGEVHLVYGPNPDGTESETSDVYQILDDDWMDKGALGRLPVDENKITNLIEVFNILNHSYEKSRVNESAELKVYLHEILRVSRGEYRCYSAYLGSFSMKGPSGTIYLNGTLELRNLN